MRSRPCLFSVGRPAERANKRVRSTGAHPKQSGPEGPLALLLRRELPARLTVFVDGDRRARRRAELRTMLDAPEVIGDVPVVRPSSARDILAALNVPVVYPLPAATYVRPDRSAGDSATGRGDVPAASAADLVAENAADDPADDRARNVDAAAILDDLLPLYPATLLRRADHRAHRTDGHLVKLFVGTLSILVRRRGERCRRYVLVACIAVDRPHRGTASIHTHPCKRLIAPRAQYHATTREERVLARLPAPAVDDR